jgi:cytochrome bd-type quinol oxidase subunit 2
MFLPHNLPFALLAMHLAHTPHVMHLAYTLLAMQAESKQEDVRAAKYLKQAGMILGVCVCVCVYFVRIGLHI